MQLCCLVSALNNDVLQADFYYPGGLLVFIEFLENLSISNACFSNAFVANKNDFVMVVWDLCLKFISTFHFIEIYL